MRDIGVDVKPLPVSGMEMRTARSTGPCAYAARCLKEQ